MNSEVCLPPLQVNPDLKPKGTDWFSNGRGKGGWEEMPDDGRRSGHLCPRPDGRLWALGGRLRRGQDRLSLSGFRENLSRMKRDWISEGRKEKQGQRTAKLQSIKSKHMWMDPSSSASLL